MAPNHHQPRLYFASIVLFFFSLLFFSIKVGAATSDNTGQSISGQRTSIPEITNSKPVIQAPAETRGILSLPQSAAITDTQTISPTQPVTPTLTPTSTPTPFPTITPLPTQLSFLPQLLHDHFVPTPTPFPEPETVLFCDSMRGPIAIPDNDPNGISNDLFIGDSRSLVSLRLYLDISHSFVGDLVVSLTNISTGKQITVLDRPGSPPYGCANPGIVTILGDNAIQKGDEQCASTPYAISGIYLPTEPLEAFRGMSVSGSWRLNVSDRYINDTGTLNHGCLETHLSDFLPPPTPPPTPISLPSSAYVYGMSGQNQHLKLDCESRSAVDWAAHYGNMIDELDFLYHLPFSDDPDTGFVGNPAGNWGNIPPNDYGVNAAPVATVLKNFGLTASSSKTVTWDQLRTEIASGNPVIVWIIGDNYRNIVNGTPHYYTSYSTGKTTVVAPFEHTVILVGYTPSSVTVLNGARFMEFSVDQFLDSWSVLDFMVVLAR